MSNFAVAATDMENAGSETLNGGSLLGDSFLLDRADDTVVSATGSGKFTSWLATNEKSATYALARLPALHIVFWVVVLSVLGPAYFPMQTERVLLMYFGYALPRFLVILLSGSIACYLCVRRNAQTATTSFIDRVPPRNSIAFVDVTHIIIICIYSEPIEKIAETMDTLASQMEVSRQMVICMATEARDINGARSAKELRRRYGDKFKGFYITQHEIQPGEVAGKSSNENWAARCMKLRLVDELGMDLGSIVSTSCDSDTFFHKQHFAELTYHFCVDPDRYCRFWQTPIVHHGNLMELPLLCQARYGMISVAHMGVSNAPWFRALPFSTYALSLQLAVQAGYWDPHVISEDYHMYLKCFFATGGRAAMKYMWLPVACDVPITETTFSTIKACYDQHVRWMWGSMDIGFFLVRCFLNVPNAPSVPLWRKIYLFLTMYEFHLLYPAMWIIIAIAINLYGIDMSQYYKMAPPIYVVLFNIICSDFCLREMAMADRMHVHSSLKGKGLCYRIRWPLVVFGLYLGIADVIFQTLATYHSQFKSAWNPILEYKVSPKLVSFKASESRSRAHVI